MWTSIDWPFSTGSRNRSSKGVPRLTPEAARQQHGVVPTQFQARDKASIFAAQMKSFSDSPPIEWVENFMRQ